jgi:adenosylcobinamide kinase/adenosylcobinamide-phosphate guanylyltransferase
MSFPRLSLIIGGANSGKSLFAEQLVTQSGVPKRYIATAQAFDAEMRAKIEAHRMRRGPEWTTVEALIDLSGAIGQTPVVHIALVDCLTLWLANLLLANHDIAVASDAVIDGLKASRQPIVLVTNEVGMGVVPDTPLGRAFRAAQGALNQRVAVESDLVVTVIAGLPLVL